MSSTGQNFAVNAPSTGSAAPEIGVTLGPKPGALQENPVGLAVGFMGLGFLIGWLLPAAAFEHRIFGPIGEQLTAVAKVAVSDMIEQGKTAAVQAVFSAFSAKSSNSSRAS